MKENKQDKTYEDPWEEAMTGPSLISTLIEDEGRKVRFIPKPEHISGENWDMIYKLRKFFTSRFQNAYEKRLPKDEVLRTFEAKRIYEKILVIFLGSGDEMKLAQDYCIRDLEKQNRYIIKALHSTITSGIRDEEDNTLRYENIIGDDV